MPNSSQLDEDASRMTYSPDALVFSVQVQSAWREAERTMRVYVAAAQAHEAAQARADALLAEQQRRIRSGQYGPWEEVDGKALVMPCDVGHEAEELTPTPPRD